jgi:hypothetical protein
MLDKLKQEAHKYTANANQSKKIVIDPGKPAE